MSERRLHGRHYLRRRPTLRLRRVLHLFDLRVLVMACDMLSTCGSSEAGGSPECPKPFCNCDFTCYHIDTPFCV
jgi:hypothetical protein